MQHRGHHQHHRKSPHDPLHTVLPCILVNEKQVLAIGAPQSANALGALNCPSES
jgi:hypothetical protein